MELRMNTLERFADRLYKARKNKGLTQIELADEIGISQQTVSCYESGKRQQADIRSLVALANRLDVSVDYLLGRVDY